MVTINLRLKLPTATIDNTAVITVYFKNRTNIIGTCSIQQGETGTSGLFTVAEELHDDLYLLYIYAGSQEETVLDGILFDDAPHNKSINTVASLKI